MSDTPKIKGFEPASLKTEEGMTDTLNLKPFWVIFLKDPSTGMITGTAHGHNAKADYKNNPYYIGTKKIMVNMEKLND